MSLFKELWNVRWKDLDSEQRFWIGVTTVVVAVMLLIWIAFNF